MRDHDSLERNLTDQEREAIERERRAALRALFDWLAEMRLPVRGVWRQASFYEEAQAWWQPQPQQNRKP